MTANQAKPLPDLNLPPLSSREAQTPVTNHTSELRFTPSAYRSNLRYYGDPDLDSNYSEPEETISEETIPEKQIFDSATQLQATRAETAMSNEGHFRPPPRIGVRRRHSNPSPSPGVRQRESGLKRKHEKLNSSHDLDQEFREACAWWTFSSGNSGHEASTDAGRKPGSRTSEKVWWFQGKKDGAEPSQARDEVEECADALQSMSVGALGTASPVQGRVRSRELAEPRREVVQTPSGEVPRSRLRYFSVRRQTGQVRAVGSAGWRGGEFMQTLPER